MRRLWLMLVLTGLFAGVAAAAPVNCQKIAPTLQNLMTSPTYADGCFVQDKLFNNFGYVQGDVANPLASSVYTSFALTPGPNPPEGDLHEIRFTAVGRTWTKPFTITYDVSLYLAPLGTSIVQSFFDINVPGGDSLPFGTQTMTGANGNYSLTATVPSPGTANIANEIALAVKLEVNPAGQHVSNIVDSYTQDFTAPVPESATIGLVGAGLVLIGLLRRRK